MAVLNAEIEEKKMKQREREKKNGNEFRAKMKKALRAHQTEINSSNKQ